ncbi:MAG: hypothetical protein GY795_34345 [Desulfobacterales bacterium]|nr:hypothetical protein [Desulfobacterales bacterium]
MRQKTLAWFLSYTTGLGASYIKGPIFALGVYILTFYTQFSSWAKGIKDGRWSLYASLGLMTSYLFKKGGLTKLSHLKMPQMKWMVLIIIDMVLITPMAVNVDASLTTLFDYIKFVVLYYLIVHIITDKKHYKIFVWIQIVGNFQFGWEAYTRGKYLNGRLENIGGPGAMGSNHLASHLVMVLPYIAIMVLYGNKWEKLGACLAAAFVLNTLILCNSRGSFLAIGVMIICAFVLAKKWMWKKFIIGLALAAFAFTAIGGAERVMARLETVQSYEEDGSAMGRVDSWKGGLRMAMDYPLGGGGDGFIELSPIYIPEVVAAHGGSKRSIHNTYLMMLTNWGFQGLILFLAFIGSTILELHRIRKRTGTKDDRFYHLQGLAIELAIIAYVVASTFGNRIYFESLYWYTAISAAISNIQQSEIIDEKLNETQQPMTKK